MSPSRVINIIACDQNQVFLQPIKVLIKFIAYEHKESAEQICRYAVLKLIFYLFVSCCCCCFSEKISLNISFESSANDDSHEISSLIFSEK